MKKLEYVIVTIVAALLICSCGPSRTDKIIDDEVASSSAKLKIEYLAHASFILTYKDKSLLLDPFADTTWIGYSFPRDIKADVIFSTHPHYDHDGGIFRDLKPYWQGTMPFYQDPGDYSVGGFKVVGLKGKHSDPYGKEFGQKNTIFIFEVAGMRIAHWGDNGPLTDSLAAALHDIDILMLPIDDTFHILKEDETREVIQTINPKLVIPMHYKIPALEPTPGHPKNLGPIEKYFKERSNVTRLDGNIAILGVTDLPKSTEYLIFQHSPAIYQ